MHLTERNLEEFSQSNFVPVYNGKDFKFEPPRKISLQPIVVNDTSPVLMGLTVAKVIARGSFGIILECIQNLAHSAVKLIPLNRLDRFSNNTISSEKLYCDLAHHPNIAKASEYNDTELFIKDIKNIESVVKETGSEDSIDYFDFIVKKAESREVQSISVMLIKMELCGPTLAEWLHLNCNKSMLLERQRGSDDNLENVQVEIISGLVNAVKFLHSRKIIHRDIKPENILFTRSDKNTFTLPIKLCDFGVCKKLEGDDLNLEQGIGTIRYRAPEMNSSQYGFNADLYSLGLVFFEVLQLIGRRERDTMFMELVMNGNMNIISSHNNILNSKEIIFGMTRPDPKERLKSIEEVASLLEKNKDAKEPLSSQVLFPNKELDFLSSGTCRFPMQSKKCGFGLV